MNETIIRYLTMAIVVVTALPVHEAAHGWAADRLGDHTARDAGRLTLNPMAHLDLFGSLALVLFGFGWAKPVPINPSRMRKPRSGLVLTALAGPFSNLLMAGAVMVIFKFYLHFGNTATSSGILFAQIIYTVLQTNLTLAVFNLLPVPPLDGSTLLTALLPVSWRMKLHKYERVFYVILILLLYLGVLRIPMNIAAEVLFSGLNWATAGVDFLLQLLG